MNTITKRRTPAKPVIWHAQPTSQPTLFFTTQTRPGWTPAHRGSYVLLFPTWYRIDVQGELHRVGLTAIATEAKATTTVGSWQEDLERLLCRPLEGEMHAFRAQLPFTLINQCSHITDDPLHLFPASTYILVGAYLYQTDHRGNLLQALGECSARTIKTCEDFERVVRQLTGLTLTLQIHQREKIARQTRALQLMVTPRIRMRRSHSPQSVAMNVMKGEHHNVQLASVAL